MNKPSSCARTGMFISLVVLFSIALLSCATTSPASPPEPVAESSLVETPTEESSGPVIELAFERDLLTSPDDHLQRSQVSLLWWAPGGEKNRVALDEVSAVCGDRGYGGPDDASEVLYLQCWWGGQGMDYRVRRDGDTLVVERQYQAEEIAKGDEDPFEVIHRVPVDPDVELRALPSLQVTPPT